MLTNSNTDVWEHENAPPCGNGLIELCATHLHLFVCLFVCRSCTWVSVPTMWYDGVGRLAQPVEIRRLDHEEMGREWGNSSIYVANIFWIKTDHGEALQLVWAGRSLVAQANVKNFFLYDDIICDFKQCSRKVLSKILMWNYFQIFFVEGFLLMSPICENKRGLQSNFLFLQRPQIEQLKH